MEIEGFIYTGYVSGIHWWFHAAQNSPTPPRAILELQCRMLHRAAQDSLASCPFANFEESPTCIVVACPEEKAALAIAIVPPGVDVVPARLYGGSVLSCFLTSVANSIDVPDNPSSAETNQIVGLMTVGEDHVPTHCCVRYRTLWESPQAHCAIPQFTLEPCEIILAISIVIPTSAANSNVPYSAE